MVFECACGERYEAPDQFALSAFRCQRCGSVAPAPFQRPARTLPWVGLAALAIAVLAGLLILADAEAGDSGDRPGVAMRVETVPADAGDGAVGRGVLKVINESGKDIALRLIGPEYRDSRTILITAWQDRRVFGLTQGNWVAKYCKGSGWLPEARRFANTTACAELDEPIQYTETVADETLQYGAAVVRFGPSPGESPAAHAIAAEDFAAD